MIVAQTAATALIGFGMLISHNVADHWVQTSSQAADKGLPGLPGKLACAAHVAFYTATTAATVGFLWLLFDLPISFLGFVAGQLVSALSHYWADRRFTLERLCRALGKGDFYDLGRLREGHDDNPSLGTGAYALDQSWHWAWIFIATIVTVLLP